MADEPISKPNRNEKAAYYFHQGTNYHAADYLGAHMFRRGWFHNATFRVWAPNAVSVSVVGEWNNWDPDAHPMIRVTAGGVWERVISDVVDGQMYKYAIRTVDGQLLEKSDPYAFYAELRPGTASRTYTFPKFQWEDSYWMEKRKECNPYEQPLNIYELHAGSWQIPADGEPLSYAELGKKVVPYLRAMGYNCVELLPICEYPLDDSWGYQTTGYFAPTSRYGTPEDLMHFVNDCHKSGITVLLDWVPSHFPKNADALARFDGQPCYEYRDPDKGEHKQWGTLVFDYGRNEVQSFLISSALFWLNTYHIDGLRVDAVASMLYLDYMRQPGEWKPNDRGGNDHAEAVAFLQKLNRVVHQELPDALMIAEESSNWGGVTSPDGLGFNYKWNMGWMNDLLAYTQADPVYRGAMHDKLTFQLTYAFNENYILPISHDEVVHGKKSLLDKMPGSYEEKFAGMRLFLLYMYTQPGKKLMFMGQEFGQFIEWDYRKELDWFLIEQYESHRKLYRFTRDVNMLYLHSPELWNDGGWSGFQWIDCHDVFGNTIVYRRIASSGKELIILCNFSNTYHEEYRIGVPQAGLYREIFNTDEIKYGGKGVHNPLLCADDIPYHGLPNSVKVKVAPLSAIVLEPTTGKEMMREAQLEPFGKLRTKLPDGTVEFVEEPDAWAWYSELKEKRAREAEERLANELPVELAEEEERERHQREQYERQKAARRAKRQAERAERKAAEAAGQTPEGAPSTAEDKSSAPDGQTAPADVSGGQASADAPEKPVRKRRKPATDAKPGHKPASDGKPRRKSSGKAGEDGKGKPSAPGSRSK